MEAVGESHWISEDGRGQEGRDSRIMEGLLRLGSNCTTRRGGIGVGDQEGRGEGQMAGEEAGHLGFRDGHLVPGSVG